MADLSITASSVVPGADAAFETGLAGEAIAAGKAAAFNPATNLWMLADNNSATAALKSVRGVAVCSCAAGQPVTVQKSGSLTIGATVTPGTAYYLSDTAGGICPLADLASGEGVSLIGIATSASVLALSVKNTGATI